MSPLPSELRSLLERAIIKAREEAEEAAKVALTALAVRDEPFSSLTAEQRHLRIALRAKARQLGGDSPFKDIGFKLLVEEVAYV